jgi:hydrogenase maturation factor
MPARVLSVEPDFAVVESGGRRRRAWILLEPGVQPGDWVVIAAGAVLRRIDAPQAQEMFDGFERGMRKEIPQ